MANDHYNGTGKQEKNDSGSISTSTIGCYALENGALVSISRESVADYADMRAAHLDALNAMMRSIEFEDLNVETRHHAYWLAHTLSEEIKALIKIVGHKAVRAP